jgi:predicted secreted protein
VTLVKKSKAEYTEVTGKLVWQLKNIPSGGKESIEFTYAIKHPKTKPVQLERKKTQWVPRY